MGEVEENATLVRGEKTSEDRTKEMVVSLLGSLDHPERINAEDAANITVKKLQVTSFLCISVLMAFNIIKLDMNGYDRG